MRATARSFSDWLCAGLVLVLFSGQTVLLSASFVDTKSCEDLLVAGGGPGGLYAAWRLIEAGVVDPYKTCILEQSHRVGKECSRQQIVAW